jgi:BON domain
MVKTIWAAMVLCTGLAAQGRPAAIHQRPAAAARPAMSDAELERAIRARFSTSKIAEDKFTVHVQGGVATIEGRSDVVQHKGTATRLAKNAGAVRVVNKIQLSQAAKDRASANLEKGRRRAQVKRGEARSQ